MARKIFVSYKYGDSSVYPIFRYGDSEPTTVRHYVDELQEHLDINDYINKGEKDEESLEGFQDEFIASKLRDKIYDSTVSIVLISKNMRDPSLTEKDQWIPWEISYSLRESTRNDRTSRTNSMLAVVVPDENVSYEYFLRNLNCSHCNSVSFRTDQLFQILGNNMFNRKEPRKTKCQNGFCNSEPHTGDDHSYIYPIRWDHFISDVNGYIEIADRINNNIHEYNLVKKIQ